MSDAPKVPTKVCATCKRVLEASTKNFRKAARLGAYHYVKDCLWCEAKKPVKLLVCKKCFAAKPRAAFGMHTTGINKADIYCKECRATIPPTTYF